MFDTQRFHWNNQTVERTRKPYTTAKQDRRKEMSHDNSEQHKYNKKLLIADPLH